MTDPTAGRLQALLADLVAIHPGSTLATAGRGPAAPGRRRFRLVLSRTRPRMLVPADVPGAAPTFLRRDTANDGARAAAGRALVGAVAGSPAAALAFPRVVEIGPVTSASVEQHLARQIGGDVRLALAGGAARANAKPVLGVFRPDSTEVGYCKVGLTDLAARLVTHEAVVLQSLAAARLDGIVVPVVRAAGPWDGHSLLLMDAVHGTRGAGKQLPVDAVQAVIASAGVYVTRLAESPWVPAVDARSRRAPEAVGARLRTVLAALVARAEADAATSGGVLHGSWHGDWGPWNMAWSGGNAVVWDWERFASDVPAGLDAVHFTAHAPLRQVGDLAGALEVLLARAEPAVRQVLARWPEHVNDAAVAARLVVDAYLVEIASRFAADAAEVEAGAVRRLAEWYVQVAEARVLDAPVRTGSTDAAGSSR